MDEKKQLSNREIIKALIQGTDQVESVETEVGTFQIRPLSLGEKSEISAIPMKGLNAGTKGNPLDAEPQDIEIKIDMSELQRGEDEIKFLAVAYGLSIEKETITPDQVKAMKIKSEVLDIIFGAISKISEIDEAELLPFRGKFRELASQGIDLYRKQVQAEP